MKNGQSQTSERHCKDVSKQEEVEYKVRLFQGPEESFRRRSNYPNIYPTNAEGTKEEINAYFVKEIIGVTSVGTLRQ